MRQRHSFPATAWESLEGRELLTTGAPVQFPNLLSLLIKSDQAIAAQIQKTGTPGGTSNGSGQQPQVIIVQPVGYIDPRIHLTRNDVAKLDAAVNNFVNGYGDGTNAAKVSGATATFKSDLNAFDKYIKAEQGVSGGTTNLLLPLLNNVPLAKYEVDNLKYIVHNFTAGETYNANNTIKNQNLLTALEAGLNLLIFSHPKK